MNAARIAALSFGAVILLGTLLLLLPVMSRDGESAGLLTSLFTATSATCVTGLALAASLPTSSDFPEIFSVWAFASVP